MFKQTKNGALVRVPPSGFTLIEVLIVVVIVGVLLMVAMPSYEDSMQKGRRSDAKSALIDVANRQESFMLDNNTYTTDLTNLGFTESPFVSEEEHYSVRAATCAAAGIDRCYRIIASARDESPQRKDKCGSFILESGGAKSVSGSGSDCW